MDSTSSYYDYTPAVRLQKAVAIAGSDQSRYREVAYDLVALSGLPLKDLSHWIGHVAGKSVAELRTTVEGYQRYLYLEEEMLPRLLTEQPFGVAVLERDTLVRKGNVEYVRHNATLVYMNLSEPIGHSIAMQTAEIVVDVQHKSIGETARFLNAALPKLAEL